MDYERRYKEKHPVVAICYDFDKTLSPDDMQAQGYIQSVGYNVKDFWDKSNALARANDMDTNLAYMYTMMVEAQGNLLFTKKNLEEYGSKVKLFKGVDGWFDRIRDYGKTKGVIVEHYIISSGLKEMIEGTSIAKKGVFEKIYASSFYYNERNVAVWPAQVINYTSKTQFLFRIEKGTLDINDPAVNDYFPPDQMRVPFRNIVYIGDSDTDIPCMKLVNSSGGHSIGVPLAVCGKETFIASSASMTIHPVRMSGTVIAAPETYRYFERIRERIVRFVAAHSHISEERFRQLMLATGDMANDVGTVLYGEEAVTLGIIDHVGSLSDALDSLYRQMDRRRAE